MNNELVTQAERMPEGAKRLVNQIKLMISNGQKLNTEEAMALAMFGYREGLDPLNGECWILKDKNGVIKGCMVGIKGLRRKVTEALGTEDVWYPEFKDISKTYDLADQSIMHAYECTIRNTKAIAIYLTQQKQAKETGLTTDEMLELFGHPPVWKGVGIVRKTEYASPNYSQVSRAKKRAEAEAIKAMMGWGYDVMDEDIKIETVGQPEEIIDGEISNVEIAEPKPIRPYPAEKVRENIQKLSEKYADKTASAEQKNLMVGMIEMCFAGSSKEITEMKRHEICSYLSGEASSKKIADKYVIAILDWLKPAKDSGGAYTPDGMAVKEAGAILIARAEESGQEKLI
jgi:hypothetical protein